MERRLAAIVCADVAGYSRMMGTDEAGTHAAFKAHHRAIHPIILNHGGRVVKNTGDGFLLEFPSVVGATEAAIAMQLVMAERNNHLPVDRAMHFRLGVHMGDVIALQSFYRVLSRNSTFPFKGKNLNARLIAREIDATYLIQGSVRRAGNKIRVTAELIAPETGEQ